MFPIAALPASLLCIILSIGIGWKKKINSGVLAMAFAFAINVFLLGGSVQEVIDSWPSKLIFYLIAISLFFNFATANGTMDLIAKKLLYSMHGKAVLIPWIITAVCALVAFLGAGASTPAILGPIAFSIGIKAGLNPVLIAISIACATTIGGDNPINGYGGVISKGLIEQTIFSEKAVQISNFIWLNSAIKQLMVIAAAYLIFKGHKAEKIDMEKPQRFNSLQCKQLILIIISLAAMIVPMILNAQFPSKATKILSAIAQPQAVMIAGSIVCALLKLGNQQAVIEKIPMNTILLISGMSMLLDVAKKAGMVETIAEIMSNNISPFMVPALLVVIASFLSFFSSGTGVVCPLLYPMVESLSGSLGLNPVMLFSCIFIGAMSSSVSPFSTGGAMTIAGCPYRETKDQLSNQMILVAVIIPLISAVLAALGFFNIFHI